MGNPITPLIPGQSITQEAINQAVSFYLANGGAVVSNGRPDAITNFLNDATLDNTGTMDMSAVITAAATSAQAAGFRALWFPPGIYLAANLVTAGNQNSNLIFIGQGVMVGAYRKRIIPEGSPTGRPSLTDITPMHRKRLDQAVAAATPSNPAVIVLFGDSTTNGGSQTADNETPEALFYQMLQSAYGPAAANILVLQRGIGGQTWSTANYTGSNITSLVGAPPIWFTDLTQLWLSYIVSVPLPGGRTVSPDLVWCNFGMNDSGAFDYTQMIAAINYIESHAAARFSLPPDIWIMTNYNPSLQDKTYGLRANQEGRDFVAGYQRTFAQVRGYGLMDRHRIHTMNKDGYDERFSEFVAAFDGGTGLPYTFPQPLHDFAVYINLPATPLTQLWNLGSMIIPISPKNGNMLILDCDSETGNLAYTVYRAAGDIQIPRTVSGHNCATSNTTIGVCVQGSQLLIECGVQYSVNQIPAVYWLPILAVERHGGLFTPTLSMSGGATTTNLILRARVGVHPSVFPVITDNDQFNPGQAVGNMGGNGKNHMAAAGWRWIDVPTFESVQWR